MVRLMGRQGTSEAERRARGLRRVVVRLPAEYVARLDAICEDSGYTRAEQLMGMIDGDWESLQQSKAAPKP